MLRTKLGGGDVSVGGGDVSVGLTVLKSNFIRERMSVGHENGCLSCVSGMRSKRRFSSFWGFSLMIVLCPWKRWMYKFYNEFIRRIFWTGWSKDCQLLLDTFHQSVHAVLLEA